MNKDTALLVIDVQRGLIDYHNEILNGFNTDDSEIQVKKTNEIAF